MSSLPKITVITVCRNAEATLPRAMESVISQNYPNLEYLVLDAQSTDGTLDIIRKNEAHISHWRSEKDDGPNDAYNEGIERATGEFIGLLNADDWYEPGILQAIGEAHLAHPEARIITCEARVMKKDEDGSLVETRRFEGKNLELSPIGSPMPNARFFHKSIFKEFGPFMVRNPDGTRMIASDLEYLLRVSCNTPPHHIVNKLGYTYFMHEDSITFGADSKRMKQMYDERTWLARHYLARPEIARAYAGRLKRWHRRGTTRAFYWNLQGGDYKKALDNLKDGIAVSNASWLADATRLLITGRFNRL